MRTTSEHTAGGRVADDGPDDAGGRPDLSEPGPARVFGELFDRHARPPHRYPARHDVLPPTSWAGLDSDEVAQALGIPVGTVRSRPHRARTGLAPGCAPASRTPRTRRPAMSDDDLHRTWTEHELDFALAEFNAGVRTDESVPARARVAPVARAEQRTDRHGRVDRTATRGALPPGVVLVDEVRSSRAGSRGPRPRRPGRRALVGAAAVGVLVAGALVAQTVSFGGSAPPASAEAVATLDRAAVGAIGAVDEPVGPGRYRYVATRAWWMASSTGQDGRPFAHLAENLLETWAPADPTGEWLLRRDVTGNQQWVLGTEEEARAAGVPTTNTWPRGGWPEGDERARCGDFTAEPDQQCRRPGGWQHPTAQWQADLPTDPDELLERLEHDLPPDDAVSAEVRMLDRAATALRGGLVDEAVRANLYQALAKLPGLRVTDRQADLDGRTGTALGVDDGHVRQEIIIDPGTGRFIGERRIATRDVDGFPAGTVMTSTSVETGVADTIGTKPAP
ncbi:CU044_5270 family protein [Saccharothrix sp. BKS2]|uniref:CU044_5270 family protein n=1 Tax=Saccharothrix sp. BKS2 TaxID=3064400 RepID=UPI0039EC61D6